MSDRMPLIRDMELVRQLLIYAAENTGGLLPADQPGSTDHSPQVVAYHIDIMVERGLLKAVRYADGTWGIEQVTWEGQDFLQAAQDDTIWDKAKAQGGKHFGSLPLEIVKELVMRAARQAVGLE